MVLRVLFVGQNPGRNQRSSRGVRPSSAIVRLHRWMDEMGVAHAAFVNVGHVPGARYEWELGFLAGCCEGHSRVVALGRVASEALSRIGINHHRMPHPSGLNRLLNDPETVSRYLSSCRSYLESQLDEADTHNGNEP